jgi:ferritin-like metal-binding protein YciE
LLLIFQLSTFSKTHKTMATKHSTATASPTQTQSSKSQAKETSSQNGSPHATGKGKSKTLRQLFEEGLLDIYNAEKQLIEALPGMAEAAYNEELQDAFTIHLEQTKKHKERLEKIFNRLNMDTEEEETCKAMEGLIEEGQKIIEEFDPSPVRDAALIIGAQKIEHYEIASYGSLNELAEVLGYHKVADILDRTLEEEEDTDLLLTEIAQEVNDEAMEISEEERE